VELAARGTRSGDRPPHGPVPDPGARFEFGLSCLLSGVRAHSSD
jgi:hypothetical protein